MERGDDTDSIDVIEGRAPFLNRVQHMDRGTYVCCSEVPKVKRRLCESEGRPRRPSVHCLCKNKKRHTHQSEKSVGLNERDILFRPIRWRCKMPRKMSEKMYEPSLGAPIGLATSSFSMSFLEAKPAELAIQGFATLLISYAEYFVTPEIEWDEKVLNRILLEGQRLFNESKAELQEGEGLNEASIKKTFMHCDNAFDIKVHDPFLIGNVIGEEIPVPNLHWGLLKFFKKFQFCLLQIGNWFVLIWKNADVYFVFDCFGRRIQDLRSDRKRGIAVLICLRNLDNVSHLIMNLSGVRPEMLFTIRQLQIRSLVACGGKPTPDLIDRTIQYEILSPDYALLRASIHLGSVCFREIRHRHSLPVALCCLINAKIDATPTWDTGVLDKILKLGAEFYKQWSQCDISLDMGIQDVPNRFVFGQFMVQIAVTGITECGMWKCTPNYRESEITLSLRRAFDQGSNLLVQIQGRSYALWKKGTFYYVLDPYSHKCSVGKKKIITASLRMCGNLDRLCCVFTQALLELFEESKFLIRVVKILELEELDKIDENRRRAQTPCMCLATAQTDIAEEVKSINESVLGVDGYDCGAEVAPVESECDDLDSPGLSQTRMEDYTDMRKDIPEDSDEDTDEDDDGVDLDKASGEVLQSRHEDDDDDEGIRAKADKSKKKDKKAAGGDKKDKDKDKGRSDSAGGDGDGGDGEDRGRKRAHETDDEDAKDKKKKKEDNDRKSGTLDKSAAAAAAAAEAAAGKKKGGKDADDGTEKGGKKRKSDTDDKAVEDKKKKTDESADDTKKQTDQDQDEFKSNSERQSLRSSTDVSSKTPTRRQKRQRRKEQDGDDASSAEVQCLDMPVGCKPNAYPGFTEDPQDLAVVGSESGSYESLCSLLKSAFRCADRVLTMTPWGNYVAFHSSRIYFIFDGCTCNLRSIRHMDLSVGTAGLLCFPDMHSLITYIESGKEAPRLTTSSKRDVIDQICSEYCGQK